MRSRRLLVGNWKMNPSRQDDARRILAVYRKAAAKLRRTSIVACPPFIYLPLAAGSNKVLAGAQDVSFEDQGPFTGEVGAKMIRDLGAKYAIVGHSERRRMGETDETVSRKAAAAVKAGLTAIVCVGETARDAEGSHMAVIKEQIGKSLAAVPKIAASKVVIAYEPVWAIGAAEAMKPEDVRETALFIKKTIADIFGHQTGEDLAVLYGGAVNWRNAGDILRVGGVAGLLVGRESVNLPGFVELVKAVDAA